METQHTQTYLVTGGAGFVGSHLCELLLTEGHQVLAIDNLSTGRLENIAALLKHPRFHFARASITDEIVMDRMAAQSDVIIHLAAAVGVRLVIEQPVHTLETNIMGTEAVLKSALRYRCRVLLASTSEVYGKGSKIPFSEADDVLLGPTAIARWGYAASKMVDEFLGLAYHHEYGLDVTPFRLFNTVGPRQSSRYGMVIPKFVQQALRSEPITVHGDGQQTRCFCDVGDVIRAIYGLAQVPDTTGQVFNIGGDEEISILELANRVKDLTDSASEIRLIPYTDVFAVGGFEDMQRRVPSIERIKAHIGWQPQRDLNAILQGVIDYEVAALNP
ncbi:MAG: NAD-dependent epimerase/dehydratase family protein [Chloroflexi bacterium]|nr:NAD-dependent epimerase/dehydratase family protein [Chloroflexota bacterium]